MSAFAQLVRRARQAPREQNTTSSTAEAIVAAAAAVRAGGLPSEPPTGLAKQILDAGAARRGEKQ
jgi:hypothetical protein